MLQEHKGREEVGDGTAFDTCPCSRSASETKSAKTTRLLGERWGAHRHPRTGNDFLTAVQPCCGVAVVLLGAGGTDN